MARSRRPWVEPLRTYTKNSKTQKQRLVTRSISLIILSIFNHNVSYVYQLSIIYVCHVSVLCPSIFYLYIYLSIHLSVYPSIRPSIPPSQGPI